MIVTNTPVRAWFSEMLVVLVVSLHIILWSLSYSLSLSLGKIKYPHIFLSSAIDKDPSRAIASIILPFISILTGVILYLRSVLLKSRLKTRSEVRLWWTFNISSVVSSVTLIAIPGLPFSYVPVLHMSVAFVLFVSGFLIVAASFLLDHKLRLPVAPWVFRLRAILMIGAILGSMGFAACFFVNALISSVCELIAVVSMNLYICSLAHRDDFFGLKASSEKLCVTKSSSRVTSQSYPLSTTYTEESLVSP